MGSLISILNQYFSVFLFLFLLLCSFSCPISCDQTVDLSDSNRPAGYRVFYVKNARPLFLNRRREVTLNGRRKTERTMMIKRKKKKVTAGDSRSTRSFAVMLPKGFVPPSGSSPCHNENPNSAVPFYCELSAPNP